MGNRQTVRTRTGAAGRAAPRWWQETKRRARLLEWPVVAALGLAGLVLGTWGFWRYIPRGPAVPPLGHFLNALYSALQLIALEFNWQDSGTPVPVPLQIARFMLPPVAGWTALRAVYSLFHDQAQLLKIWLLYRRHAIVCGLGQKGMALVRDLRARGERVVVVELDAENDFIGPCRDAGAKVLVGDATAVQTLMRAGVAHASLLLAVTPQDSVNVEIANRARTIKLQPGCSETLTCIIQLQDIRFCHDLRGWALADRASGRFRLELFNSYRDGARKLCAKPPAFTGAEASPHVVVVGTGRMAVAACECLAREWLRLEKQRHREDRVTAPFWEWLSARRSRDECCRVTLVGPDATAAARLLLAQREWIDRCCKLVGRDIAVPSAEFESGAFLTDTNEVDRAYVCLDDGEAAFVAGITLVRLLDGSRVPVTAVVENEAGIARCTGIGQAEAFPGAFPLLERVCDFTIIERGVTETVARAIHEQWRVRAGKEGRQAPTWEEAPEYMRDSSRAAVGSYRDCLMELGFQLRPLTDPRHADEPFSAAEIEELARREHDRWVEERTASGWSLGEVYDDSRKTSPWLRLWDDKDYTGSDRDYDREQASRLPEMLAEVDIEVRRDRWVQFGRKLFADCRHNAGQSAGPELTGEVEEEWIARAGEVVRALRLFGYELAALPRGGARAVPLPGGAEEDFDVEGGVCRVLDPGFDALDVTRQQARRAAASRIPGILTRLGFEIRPMPEERLAIALHVHYCRTRRAAGDTPATNPSMKPWRELPGYKRDSNRLAARDVGRKLQAVGCHVRERREGEPLFEFEPEEVELIARLEHERWMEEKLGQDWKYGPVRSDREKTNPYLRPWEELAPAERENDLATARGLPGLLADGGQQIERDQRDIIGRAIHEEYRRSLQSSGQKPEENPSLVPWYRLPPHLRESNRKQADDIRRKLESIGCRIVPLAEAGAVSFEFTADEIERLAKEEHDRWVKEREAEGWRPGPKKDIVHKLSPWLVPWEQLPEDVKDYDRNAVRAIPLVLAAAGLSVRRQAGT